MQLCCLDFKSEISHLKKLQSKAFTVGHFIKKLFSVLLDVTKAGRHIFLSYLKTQKKSKLAELGIGVKLERLDFMSNIWLIHL